MKLHTSLGATEVSDALEDAKKKGHISEGVSFTVFEPHLSRSAPNGYEIQLGTYDKNSLPEGTCDRRGKPVYTRRFGNGQTAIYAATYDEWGWFISEVYRRDPEARFNHYLNQRDFHVTTGYRFPEEED